MLFETNNVSIFTSAYGSEVGCVGIKLIPTGGLYVTGGLTPKNMNWIEGKGSHFRISLRCFLCGPMC